MNDLKIVITDHAFDRYRNRFDRDADFDELHAMACRAGPGEAWMEKLVFCRDGVLAFPLVCDNIVFIAKYVEDVRRCRSDLHGCKGAWKDGPRRTGQHVKQDRALCQTGCRYDRWQRVEQVVGNPHSDGDAVDRRGQIQSVCFAGQRPIHEQRCKAVRSFKSIRHEGVMTDRIKPQIEMDAADYKKFRAKCQEIPVRWVVEAMIQSILASNTIDLPEIIETLRGQVKRGERRIHGRPVGRRDSFKRNRKPRQQQGRG